MSLSEVIGERSTRNLPEIETNHEMFFCFHHGWLCGGSYLFVSLLSLLFLPFLYYSNYLVSDTFFSQVGWEHLFAGEVKDVTPTRMKIVFLKDHRLFSVTPTELGRDGPYTGFFTDEEVVAPALRSSFPSIVAWVNETLGPHILQLSGEGKLLKPLAVMLRINFLRVW